jgi:hypothetical protein
MITEVRQAMQQIGASRRRGFKDGEIVFALNKMQDRFIERLVRPKKDGTYDISSFDQQSIRPILVVDKPLRCYRTDATYGMIPGDVHYLLGKTAHLSCTGAFTATTAQFMEIAFTKSTKVSANYYAVKVTMNGVDVIDIPAKYTYNDEQALAEVVELVAGLLEAKGHEVYRDRFGNVPINDDGSFLPSIILYVKNPVAGNPFSVTVDGTVQELDIVNFAGIQASGSVKAIPIELYDHLIVHEVLQTPYYRPSVNKAVGVLDGNQLKVYGPDSSIVVSILVNYIRKPQQMNLILARDCELPSQTCHAICDLTVEFLRSKTDADQLGADISDNKRNTALT